MLYKEIKSCRICGSNKLIPIVDLGNMALSGYFPKSNGDQVEAGPLELVKCDDSSGSGCGLVQLRHNYNLEKLYGDNYGYRSGLNQSMVKHLHSKVNKILSMIPLSQDDLVIDIGSNDSTLLQAYPKDKLTLVGVDPTGKKFKEYYPEHIHLVADFFPSASFLKQFGHKKIKIVTSISMFYDLEDPMTFVTNIHDNLDDNGVWVFEQSYMPTMLERNSYDTICHEHLEYYALKQIKYMLDKAGLKIIDVEFNDINGGSFSVMAAKKGSKYNECTGLIDKILNKEKEIGLNSTKPFNDFNNRISKCRDDLLAFFKECKKDGKVVFGYGASTKGNVLLQFCKITAKDMPYIAEVNEDKFGCYTPGTNIPIISEAEAKKMSPDYFMVLPWHFKDNIIKREGQFLSSGKHFMFPLPTVQII
ncbi:MAG: class I SAM-dependent methyltransferase [bacterium]